MEKFWLPWSTAYHKAEGTDRCERGMAYKIVVDLSASRVSEAIIRWGLLTHQ